jgi:hypothetical protein
MCGGIKRPKARMPPSAANSISWKTLPRRMHVCALPARSFFNSPAGKSLGTFEHLDLRVCKAPERWKKKRVERRFLEILLL